MTAAATRYLHLSLKSASRSRAGQEKYPAGPLRVFCTDVCFSFRGSRAPLKTDKAAAFLVSPAGRPPPFDPTWQCPVTEGSSARTQHSRDPPPHRSPHLPPPKKHSPALTRAEIRSRRRQGVLWLYSALRASRSIAFSLEVPLSNVGHFVQIRFFFLVCVCEYTESRTTTSEAVFARTRVCVCVCFKPWCAATDVWWLVGGWVLMYKILMFVYFGSILDQRAIYLSDAWVAVAPSVCCCPNPTAEFCEETLEQINLWKGGIFSK